MLLRPTFLDFIEECNTEVNASTSIRRSLSQMHIISTLSRKKFCSNLEFLMIKDIYSPLHTNRGIEYLHHSALQIIHKKK